jgi:hypothetical protein
MFFYVHTVHECELIIVFHSLQEFVGKCSSQENCITLNGTNQCCRKFIVQHKLPTLFSLLGVVSGSKVQSAMCITSSGLWKWPIFLFVRTFCVNMWLFCPLVNDYFWAGGFLFHLLADFGSEGWLIFWVLNACGCVFRWLADFEFGMLMSVFSDWLGDFVEFWWILVNKFSVGNCSFSFFIYIFVVCSKV